MTELLLMIDAHADADSAERAYASIRWRIIDGPTTLRSGTGLPPQDARVGPVRVLLGARVCPVHRVRVPARQRRQMLRAIPYVVEDVLATDLEREHLALPVRLRPGQVTPVAVVDRALLRSWLTRLADAQLAPVSVVPAATLVPVEDRTLTLVGVPGGWLFASPEHAGMLADTWWPVAMPGLREELRTVRIVTPADAPPLDPVRIAELESAELEVHREAFAARAEDWLVQRLADSEVPAIELLQGEFARHDDSPDVARALGWLGASAAAALVTFVAVQAGEAWLLTSAADRLREDSRALYRELFPGDKRIVDPVAQMRAHLAAGGGSDSARADFLALFAPAAEVIAGADVELANLTFNGSRGDASVEVLTREFATLERLKAGIEATGMTVEITSAEQEQGAIRARLRIRSETT